MKEVTDLSLLAELNKKQVMDPAILAQLEGTAPPELAVSHEPYKPPTVPQRLWTGFKSNLADIGKFIAQPTVVGQQLGATLASSAGRESVFAPVKESIQKSIEDPSGIPGRMANYAIDNPLEMAVNLVSFAPKGASLAKRAAPLAEAVSIADKYTPPSATIKEIVRKGMDKGVRPSVSGKASFPQREKYYANAESGVKSIIKNKDNLEYLKDSGESVKGSLPNNLTEFSDAIHQTKKAVFEKYDAMVQGAGDTPARISLEPIAKELDRAQNAKQIRLNHPEVSKHLADMSERYRGMGSLSPTEAQEIIADFNNTLKAFYRNPSPEYARKASIDAMVANRLRKDLDTFVSDRMGPGYQNLKNEYGALKAIEKDVTHRATVDARKNILGLVDFSKIWSGAELAAGLLTMNPATIAKGWFARKAADYIKHINDPNRIVQDMFKKVEKSYDPWGQTSEIPVKVIPPKQLGAGPEGPKMLPAPGQQSAGFTREPARLLEETNPVYLDARVMGRSLTSGPEAGMLPSGPAPRLLPAAGSFQMPPAPKPAGVFKMKQSLQEPKLLGPKTEPTLTPAKAEIVEPKVSGKTKIPIKKEKAQRIPVDRDGNELIDMDNIPMDLNPDGTITLYHRTSPENALIVKKTGNFKSLENTDETFFSNKLEGQAEGYGDSVISVKVRPSDVRINDAFHGGEVHVAVSNKRLSKRNLVSNQGPRGRK